MRTGCDVAPPAASVTNNTGSGGTWKLTCTTPATIPGAAPPYTTCAGPGVQIAQQPKSAAPGAMRPSCAALKGVPPTPVAQMATMLPGGAGGSGELMLPS